MDILQEKGFDILNSNKSVGAIGSSSGKWSKEKLAEVAKRYESRMEFRCGDPGAYQAAHKRGLMDEIGSHFVATVLWNKDMALEMAKNINQYQILPRMTKSFLAHCIDINGWIVLENFFQNFMSRLFQLTLKQVDF